MYDEKQIIDANEYLNLYYPKNGDCLIAGENWGKRRSEIIYLNISNIWLEKTLTGTINLSDFTNLESFNCDCNQISEIILPNPCQLKELDCTYNKLKILDLSFLFHLKKLDCFNNRLNELILPNNNQLEIIYADNNYLTSFNYGILNHNSLIVLAISRNRFKFINLSVFSHLINLEYLSIGNYYIKNNKFYGSFEAFKKCTKLRTLHIYNSKIKRGFEYLPDSIKHIFLNDLIENIQQLKNWKEDHPEIVKNAKIITELEEYEEVGDLIKEAFSKIRKIPNHPWWKAEKNQMTFQMLCDENSPFRFHWFDRKYITVEKLRAENETHYQQIEKNERSERNSEIIFFLIFFSIFFTNIFLIIRNIIRKNKNLILNSKIV